MKAFRFLKQPLLLLLFIFATLLVISAWGVTLDTDNFNSNADGWGGSGESYDGTNDRLLINRDDTATKTYDFGVDYANATVTVTMTLTEIGGWEDTDVTLITANGVGVYNSNVAGAISFNATLNGSGQLSLVVTPDTNNNSEDLAIDTISINYTPPNIPEINIQGNGVSIVNGDATPSAADHTSFASMLLGDTPVDRTYTIQNTGIATLNISETVTISGANAADFSVTSQPSSTSISAGGTTSFTIRFNPSVDALRSATVSITNDDANENPYTFSISGTGTLPSYTGNNPRSFAMSYSTNENGNIKMVGNSVFLQSGGGCPADGVNNNDITAVWALKDADASVQYNATTADLTLPAGVGSSDILYAGLYWQGRVDYGTLAADFAKARAVKLKLYGSGSYENISSISSKFNWIRFSGNGDDYQGVADITNQLKTSINSVNPSAIATSGYSQPIWVADVWSTQNRTNAFGAWSIVVVYKDMSTTFKNLNVYDGFDQISINETLPVSLSGFLTPTVSPVNSTFFVFGGEGDASLPDSVSLTNKANSDITLASNVFNASITGPDGQNITTRNPACQNTIGIDIHSYNIGTSGSPAIIGTEQNSTTVKLSSPNDTTSPIDNYDTYYPGVFAFATDLYQPHMCYVEDIFDSNGNSKNGIGVQINKNESLKVRVTIKNNGDDVAKGVQILNTFNDSIFPYTEGSTYYENLFAHTRIHATDASGDDFFEYNATKTARINLGSGATASEGGNFVPFATDANAYSVYEYTATVNNLDQNFSNSYYAAYKSDYDLDYSNNPILMQTCSGEKNSFWGYSAPSVVGVIDAVSNYTANGYTQSSGLVTRIASQPNVTFDIVWLGDGVVPINYPYEKPMPVMITLSDNACSTDEGITSQNSAVGVTITNDGNPIATTEPFDLTSKTISHAKLRLKYIDWNNLPNGGSSSCIDHSSTLGALSGVPACLNSDDKIKTAFGDVIWQTCANTGERPACQSNSYNSSNVPSPPYDNEYGCFICLANALNSPTCSSDTFSIRPNTYTPAISPSGTQKAGHEFSITTVAKGYYGGAITAYGGEASVTTQTQIQTCEVLDGNLTNSAGASFGSMTFDGVNTNVSSNLKFGDIGVFDINITDSTWTAVDSGNSECIADSNTSTIDANSRVGCLVRATTVLKVIPDHFDQNSTIANHGNGFTYVSSDLNTSARLNVTSTAKSLSGSTTKNYSSSCYANSTDHNISYSAISLTPSGNLTALKFNETNTSQSGSVNINSPIGINMPSTIFSTDTNGSATISLQINFDRNITKVTNPFVFDVTDTNITDSDSIQGSGTLDNNATFIYGRAHSARQRYTVPDDAPYGLNIYYESYCDGAGCDKTLLPNGVTSSRTDDARWYVNTNHVSSTDGNATAVTQKNANLVTASALNHNDPDTTKTELSYSGASYPYKTTMQLGVPTWLLHHETDAAATKNEFSVEFYYKDGEWTGSHETTTTTKTKKLKTNRRTMW